MTYLPESEMLPRFHKLRKSGEGKWSARCPVHEDKRASLSIGRDNGTWLLKCHAGCETGDIVRAIGLSLRDLFPGDPSQSNGTANSTRKKRPSSQSFATVEAAEGAALRSVTSDGSGFELVCRHTYRRANGEEHLRVLRFECDGEHGREKTIRPIHPDAKGQWHLRDPEGPLPLYNLEQITAAPKGSRIYVVEGEKAADAGTRCGILCTTSAHGAGAAGRTNWGPLAGFNIVILPDHDEAGRKYASQVASILTSLDSQPRIRILELPDLPEHGDLADFIADAQERAWSDEEIRARLMELVDAVPERDLSSHSPHLSQPGSRHERWPDPPHPAAFDGIAGDFVRLIGPHSEADPVALLIQVLVVFGNLIGRTAYYQVEASRHYGNEFAILVGPTARARKGTSLDRVMETAASVDRDWYDRCRHTGLSSGEGLIWAVRDSIEKRVRQESGSHELEVVDPGVEDKRALVVESEFATVLRVVGRDGNTLSGVVRTAWDRGELSSMTKNSPGKATGAHLSIIGHITQDELLRYLDRTEIGSGLANRFLFLCVRRSKLLPEGGKVPEDQLRSLVETLRERVEAARQVGRMTWDPEARELWGKAYPLLTADRVGMLGAMTARAEAHSVRVALLYALLDGATEIGVRHLRSALALWDQSDRSSAYIFGDALGDPVADTILAALRANPAGMDRTQISAVFGGHRRSSEITRALSILARDGLAIMQSIPTDGRSIEHWTAKEAGEAKKGSGDLTSLRSLISQSEELDESVNRDGGERTDLVATDTAPPTGPGRAGAGSPVGEDPDGGAHSPVPGADQSSWTEESRA